jgi:hypothetical protein
VAQRPFLRSEQKDLPFLVEPGRPCSYIPSKLVEYLPSCSLIPSELAESFPLSFRIIPAWYPRTEPPNSDSTLFMCFNLYFISDFKFECYFWCFPSIQNGSIITVDTNPLHAMSDFTFLPCWKPVNFLERPCERITDPNLCWHFLSQQPRPSIQLCWNCW